MKTDQQDLRELGHGDQGDQEEKGCVGIVRTGIYAKDEDWEEDSYLTMVAGTIPMKDMIMDGLITADKISGHIDASKIMTGTLTVNLNSGNPELDAMIRNHVSDLEAMSRLPEGMVTVGTYGPFENRVVEDLSDLKCAKEGFSVDFARTYKVDPNMVSAANLKGTAQLLLSRSQIESLLQGGEVKQELMTAHLSIKMSPEVEEDRPQVDIVESCSGANFLRGWTLQEPEICERVEIDIQEAYPGSVQSFEDGDRLTLPVGHGAWPSFWMFTNNDFDPFPHTVGEIVKEMTDLYGSHGSSAYDEMFSKYGPTFDRFLSEQTCLIAVSSKDKMDQFMKVMVKHSVSDQGSSAL